MKPAEVILIVSIAGLQDKKAFELYLAEEGFISVPHEPFTYIGTTTTQKINTVLYIFDTVEQAIRKSNFQRCKIVFQIGEYAMEAYQYDKKQNKFIAVVI